MTKARLRAVAHYTPSGRTTYSDLALRHPDWDTEKLTKTLGIKALPAAAQDEFSSDLATMAARNLLSATGTETSSIDFLVLVTQTPDFPLPTTACLVHEALGLRQEAGAVDVRLGCSGYVYALGLVKGLIEAGVIRTALLLTADVLSKVVNPDDKATAPVFGDAGTATLVTASEEEGLGPLVYGTDGSGAGALMLGGMVREVASLNENATAAVRGLADTGHDLYMDGSAVFNFTLSVVPGLVEEVVAKAGWTIDEVDLFVFHQANAFMINHLRKKLRIAPERFWVDMEDVGNTGPSTVPLALAQAQERGLLHDGMKIVLAGFGVGLSWAGAALTW